MVDDKQQRIFEDKQRNGMKNIYFNHQQTRYSIQNVTINFFHKIASLEFQIIGIGFERNLLNFSSFKSAKKPFSTQKINKSRSFEFVPALFQIPISCFKSDASYLLCHYSVAAKKRKEFGKQKHCYRNENNSCKRRKWRKRCHCRF